MAAAPRGVSAVAKQRGLIQVYTGGGKGKTTAAWGLVLRAIGRGWKVAVVRFLKGEDSGEVAAAKLLGPNVKVFGKTSPYDPCVDQRGSAKLKRESRRNFDLAREAILSGEWDMVVLDEINIVLHYDYIAKEEMLDALQGRPEHLELILTGRYAPDWLVSVADLVTEMVDVKHPSQADIEARRGIEY